VTALPVSRRVSLVIVLAGAALLAYALPGLGKVVSGTHATARHATEARVAREMLAKSGSCQDCIDGRTRCFAQEDGQWCIGVYQRVEGKLVELTAFLTTQAYVNDAIDECNPTNGRSLHP
jgi:uncharacterized low-complexity protein